jgi:hypothetical protein
VVLRQPSSEATLGNTPVIDHPPWEKSCKPPVARDVAPPRGTRLRAEGPNPGERPPAGGLVVRCPRMWGRVTNPPGIGASPPPTPRLRDHDIPTISDDSGGRVSSGCSSARIGEVPLCFRGKGAVWPARSPRPKGRGSTQRRRVGIRPPAGGLAVGCPRFPLARPPAGGLSRGLRPCFWSLVPWGGATLRAPSPRKSRPHLQSKRRPSGAPDRLPFAFVGHAPYATAPVGHPPPPTWGGWRDAPRPRP